MQFDEDKQKKVEEYVVGGDAPELKFQLGSDDLIDDISDDYNAPPEGDKQ